MTVSSQPGHPRAAQALAHAVDAERTIWDVIEFEMPE